MYTLSLISDTATPCGVEQFQRKLAVALSRQMPGCHDTCAIVGQPGEMRVLARALAGKDAVVLGLPMVAWKRRLAAPPRAMALARRLGKSVVLVVHEWSDLDWKRRALYRTYVPLATRLLFSSPYVRAQFEADRIAALCTRNRAVVPMPPNMVPPASLPETPRTTALAELRRQGKRLICTFGGIYPRKQPGALLDIVATLKARGVPAHAVYVGSFVRDSTIDVEAVFRADVARLGLENDITVTGFVDDSAEVYALLDACDALAYRFDEGLTSRRCSVFAALLSGRPIVVNGPRSEHEFDHHEAYRAALASGALTLLAPDADTPAFADAVLTAGSGSGSVEAQAVFDRAWVAAAAVVVPDGRTAHSSARAA